MPAVREVERMSINSIRIGKDNSEHLRGYFNEIVKRNAQIGNGLHEMMLEAYLLGFYDCSRVLQPLATPPKKED